MRDTDIVTVAEAASRLGMVKGKTERSRRRAAARLRAVIDSAEAEGKRIMIDGCNTTVASVKRALPQFRQYDCKPAAPMQRIKFNLGEMVNDAIESHLGHKLYEMRATLEATRECLRDHERRIAELETRHGIPKGTVRSVR